ncbi:recombinase family protein [Clostridium perfringens]|uniref:recombinase family protein n=1 Tax=Clostridium perfringens TaxID=1502 RepID=UPI002AC6E886|nr:recombinase family protein [Clostridium perfringens]MDM0839855.1 recombinase family protein [Clostridium perfringens]MDZ5019797.1 recombinase family protein [Clostridium perfringens]
MKCAIYIRVSTKFEEQQSSLANQKLLFENYVLERGWTIYEIYTDIESGTNDRNRPAFKRMLNDAQEKKFDIIMAKELSRLARNSELAHKTKRIAEENNIHILTLDNAINTIKGDLELFGLRAWLYEQESERTSQRIKHTFKTKANSGLVTGGTPPYGYYLKDNKLYVRNDHTPNIVKRIFKEYILGSGFDSIAMKLYNEGEPTPAMVANKRNANDKWHGSTIRLILQNEAYIGNLVQSKETKLSVTSSKRIANPKDKIIRVLETHEPIIDKDTFYLVQSIIKERKHKKYHQKTHLFTNIMFCNDCKKGMHFKKNRKGYVCGSFNKHGKKACSDHIIREEALSKKILSDINYFISCINDDKIFRDVESTISKCILDNKTNLKSLEDEKNSLLKQKNEALVYLINKTITNENYKLFISAIDSKIEKLTLKESKLKSFNKELNFENLLNEIKTLRSEILDLNNLTPDVLHRFVKRIEIKENGDAIIYYRFSHLPF